MRSFQLLQLAAVATALVLPDQEVFQQLSVEDRGKQSSQWSKDSILDGFKSHFQDLESTVHEASDSLTSKAHSVLDDALKSGHHAGCSLSEAAFDAKSWIENDVDHMYDVVESLQESEREKLDHPPHHRRPHHPPHHGKPNQTVYELISNSKYTTKLAALINDYPDVVDALNSTKANYTVFAPIDKAFEKIPDDAPKPSKEQLLSVLLYHVSPDFYPAGRVLVTHTFPTLLKGEHLSDTPEPQRLSRNIGLKGLTINYYSRVVAVDVFGTNGVIHGIDSILIPPPNVIKIVDLFPTAFSTLELGLGKTGLLDLLNTTDHAGGTLFAPSNDAFAKLGPKINAFLFSQVGLKYLKALLQYHVVPDITLYSDAVYKASEGSEQLFSTAADVPKGYYHFDLPTLLEDRKLAVDVARYGGFISIKINAFSRVVVQDGIAEDGVIQVVGNVLIPPKNGPDSSSSSSSQTWGSKIKDFVGEKVSHVEEEEGLMSVEEFKSRFDAYLE